MAPLRPAQWAALAVALLGIAVSLAPAARSSVAACPWLADSSTWEVARALLARLAPAALTGAAPSPAAAAAAAGGAAREFTRAQLRAFDGTCGGAHPPSAAAAAGDGATPTMHPACRVYLGVAGDVFDVTDLGAHFYGPGAGYALFAGRDSTRALSLGSLSPADVHSWRLDDFDEQKRAAVRDQHVFYSGKYPKVGVLVDDPEGDERVRQESAAIVAAAQAGSAPDVR
jgi:membrane-associated progesterone receptor component